MIGYDSKAVTKSKERRHRMDSKRATTLGVLRILKEYSDAQHVLSVRDIMKKLRTDFPEFSEVQFRFLTYIIAGFDASSLAFLLNTSKNNVWVRKSRLKDRIFNSSSTNKDLYGTFII